MSDKFRPDDIKSLVDATLKIINASKNNPDSLAVELLFLNQYVKALVAKGVSTEKIKTKPEQEQYEILRKNYFDLKMGLQEAVALGVQAAMQNFSKTQVEYYCTVTTVPKPISSEVH